MEDIWKKVGWPEVCIFPSWAAGVTILALVYVNSPVERAAEGGQAHIKRFYTAKWKKFQLCFGRLSEALGVFWVLLCSWRKAVWCGCGIGASFDGMGMGVEENGGILHNWKVKSTLAGMTWTFLHPPDVLILNFISFLFTWIQMQTSSLTCHDLDEWQSSQTC